MTARSQTQMAKVAKVICQVPYCETRTGLHRHHIVNRALAQCDDPENLIVLCDEHHRAVHRKEVDIGIYLTPAQGAKAVLLLGTVYRACQFLYPSESRKRAA